MFGTYAALALIALVAVAAARGTARKKGGGGTPGTTRIDRMHYLDPDDHECPACGARFSEDVMVCPSCGKRFTGTAEDDDEFIEEMELWDDDDD